MFSCGTSLFAVPADRAQEVVNLPPLTRVPGAPAHMLGVFAHRGEVLAVVDLVQLTGAASNEAQARQGFRRAVVLRVSRGAVALTASRVFGVSVLEGQPQPLAEAGPLASLRGPAKAPAGDVSIVEPDAFVDYLSRSADRG